MKFTLLEFVLKVTILFAYAKDKKNDNFHLKENYTFSCIKNVKEILL